MNVLKLVLLCVMFVLMSCAGPRTSVNTDDQSGTILLKVKPSTAIIEVDGTDMGKVREFDGTSQVLKVTPGKHIIRIKKEGYQTYETRVYVSDTQEVIQVNLVEENK